MNFYRNRLALGAIPQERSVAAAVPYNCELHFEGADASTTFTDESGKIWTAGGSAQITTTSPKIGLACGTFNGSSWIDTPDHADWAFGTGDFTIDLWMKASNQNIAYTFFAQRDAAGGSNADLSFMLQKASTNKVVYFYYWNGSGLSYISNRSVSDSSVPVTDIFDGVWHHLAVVRNGTSLVFYVDGVAGSSYSSATLAGGFSFSNSTKKLAIARPGEQADFYLTGQIDEFRILKGTATWTTDFTPPE